MSSGYEPLTRSRLVSFTLVVPSERNRRFIPPHPRFNRLAASIMPMHNDRKSTFVYLLQSYKSRACPITRGTARCVSFRVRVRMVSAAPEKRRYRERTIHMPTTYISKKLPSGNKAFCILARSNDVGIFRDESRGASAASRPSRPDLRSGGERAQASARTSIITH